MRLYGRSSGTTTAVLWPSKLRRTMNLFLTGEEREAAVSEEEDEEGLIEYIEGYEELEEEDDMEDLGGFAFGEDDDTVETTDDDEAAASNLSRKRKKSDKDDQAKKLGKVLVEVEHEDGSKRQTTVQ